MGRAEAAVPTALAEMTLDLAGQTLSAAAELSTSAAGLTVAPTDGVPFVTVIARVLPLGEF